MKLITTNLKIIPLLIYVNDIIIKQAVVLFDSKFLSV